MAWDIDVKEKVYQRVANEVFFRILKGQYALGAKLPSYTTIAKEAGSSPETVRKAFLALLKSGILEKTLHGYFVTTSSQSVQEYKTIYIEMAKQNYLDALQKIE